jgi:hypothetical protein
MSIRDLKVLGKFAWIALLISMLSTEFQAIDKDRKDAQTSENDHLNEERESFKGVLTQQNLMFRGLLQDDQKKFETTLKTILDSDNTNRQQFSRLMAEDKALFEHEEKLSQA